MQKGFSLVELSIVLVILGLLTGGILAGQSLIRASELRAVTAEYQRYVGAVNTFRDKYLAIPGDMTNATRFWSRTVNAAHCVTNSSAAVTTPGTCDGDGDGYAEIGGAASASGEATQAWRQMSLAGLIEGNFSGLAGPGSIYDSVINTNVPASKLSNAGWSLEGLPTTHPGNGNRYAIDYGNFFVFGADNATEETSEPALKPEEAWNIDVKLDDGKPAYGKIIARYWNNACSAADDGSHANNDFAASYKLSSTSIACALYFVKAF